jgi:hypothetical protein
MSDFFRKPALRNCMVRPGSSQRGEVLLPCEIRMASTRKLIAATPDRAGELAKRLSEELLQERIVPRFVDSYVVEHGRYALQVHAALYRDLLTLLQREALLAASAQALEIVCRGNGGREDRRFAPMTRKEAAAFRQKFLAALTRQQQWNMGTALEFQSDLQMYENILARAHSTRRSRKPFEAANHPFVDRCAFMLDSSFLENARVAASRALGDLEALTAQLTGDVFAAKERG